MSRLKEVASHTTQYIDPSTGEDLGTSRVNKTVLVKDSTEFSFMYSKLVMAFANVEFSEAKVLVWCSLHANLNTNEVLLPKLMKQRLAKDMALNDRTVDNALVKLTNKGYFHRLGTGVYHIDPEMTWKGNLKLHDKNVEVFLKYTIETPNEG